MTSFDSQLTSAHLHNIFKHSISASRAIGSDGITTKCFEKRIDDEITVIQRKVADFSYKFSPFKELLIIKNKDSKPRAVYIPTVRDRLVLSALNRYLSQKFRDQLLPYQKTVQKNVSDIKLAIASQDYDVFLKLDVKNFFPTLDHQILMEKLRLQIKDKAALSLIQKVLNRSKEGIAPGLSVASQLASIYLNALDQEYSQKPNLKYFRFVDDILILCKKVDAKNIQASIQKSMQDLKLDLHAQDVSDKSETGALNKDSLKYLGFVFLAVVSAYVKVV